MKLRLGIVSLILAGVILISCGTQVFVVQGPTGPQGPQGYGAGVVATQVSGLCGATDGVRITTFQDLNNDGIQNVDEPTTSVSSVCNGAQGMAGTALTITVSSATGCPTGGYNFAVTSNSVTTTYQVCNGTQGAQGAPGLNGAPGTVITPVKFCNNDTSRFPEYGLMVGNRLFAVYWGTTPSSPSVPESFLTEVLPGNYISTGGNGCQFTIL